ncbi:MAG: hypothetical protein WD403_13750 [Pirellulales bacterium]
MQSSPLMAFRATVMIVCLVTVPLVAVMGTALPQLLRPAERRQLAHAEREGYQGTSGVLLAERKRAVDKGAAPRLASRGAEHGSQPAEAVRAETTSSAEESRSAARPARGPGISITAVRPLSPQPTGQFWSAGANPGPPQRQGPDTTLQATVYSQPAPARGSARRLPRVPAEMARGQERLRELGAVEYRLETWGEQGELFRFQCRMPAADGSPAQRHFEATDRDPSLAVISVVREVERWRRMR